VESAFGWNHCFTVGIPTPTHLLPHWILKNSDFQQWRNDQQSRLLWIKGDPGKGKTMLLCTDSRINNATALLRGLLYLLVDLAPNVML
jgi:hypothetical protein